MQPDYELRFFCFVNFYLSSIQQGIQTGHCAVALVMKYIDNGNPFNREITQEKVDMVRQWAIDHQTFIALNGGDAYGVNDMQRIVASSDFPYTSFTESDRALRGLTTCAGIVLPETIFNAKPVTRADGVLTYVYTRIDEEQQEVIETLVYEPEHRHYNLIKALKSCHLAR